MGYNGSMWENDKEWCLEVNVMGLFDFFKRKKSGDVVAQTKTVVEEISENVSESISTKSVVQKDTISDVPDAPQPIGYKTAWLAIKDVTPEQVIENLNLMWARTANWENGMRASEEDKIFVTPVIDGYVIVTGVEDLVEDEELLDKIAQKFEEVLYFITHRIVDLHSWVKYQNGEKIRRYYYLGESGEVVSEGKMTPEEIELGFSSLLASDEDDWDMVEFADEESVMEISKAWGVDPWFEGHEEELSTGYVCDRGISL